MGSSGVQRPLKFARYLRDFGWTPVILAPEPGLYTHFDESLRAELDSLNLPLYRSAANTPFHVLGGKKSSKKSSKKSGTGLLPDSVAALLRKYSMFFYLPDNKTGWIKPACKTAEQIFKDFPVEAIFSTAPPYSNHFIAEKLKATYNVPVVMDFRDDWLESHLISYPNRLIKNKMAAQEASTLKSADAVIAINQSMLDSIQSRNDRPDCMFEVIPQGFDPQEIQETEPAEKQHLTFLYNGLFYGENQPDLFLEAFRKVGDENPELVKHIKLRFQGGLSAAHHELIKKLNLQEAVEDAGYLDHKTSLKGLHDSDLLWFTVGHSKSRSQVTTGKLFEYIGTGKPVFGVVPEEGEAADILRNYGRGFVADPADPEKAARVLETFLNLAKSGEMPPADKAFTAQFDRKKLAGKLASLLTRVAGSQKGI